MGEKINFEAGTENIVGEILGKKPNQLSDTVFFHGGGKSTKETAQEFFKKSVLDVISGLVTFDFSGHGESTGELKKGSLAQRALEAERAIDLFTTKKQLTLCGLSMGGYIALKILPQYDVKNVILFAPAMYDKQAFDVPFDQGFTEIIRKPESWKNSDILAPLEKFSGNLLLFIGKNDEVIPHGIIDLIDKHSPNASKKEIIKFEDCPHCINGYLETHPKENQEVTDKILEYYLS